MWAVSIFQSTHKTLKPFVPTERFLQVGGKKNKTDIYLVQPACEIDDDFSGSVIVNDLKLTNVTWVVKRGH